MKRKVAYIIPSLDVGGSELKTITLAKGLDKNLFDVILITITKKGIYFDELEKSGIPCFNVAKRSKLDVFVIKRIKKILVDEKVDIVHVFTSTGKLWGRLAAKRAKTPIIISTEESLFRGNFFDGFFEKYFGKITAKIICNSYSTKESALKSTKLDEALYEVIYNGVEIDPFIDIKPKKYDEIIKLISVSRFDPRKGLDLLIHGLKKLIDLDLKVHLTLVGDGILSNELKTLSKLLEVDDNITFTGYQKDIRPYLEASDIFILPSKEEGFGNALIEAMAASRAIIGSSVGGIKEIIEDGKNGLLFNSGDVDSLVVQINRLIKDETLKDTLVKNGKLRVEEFNKDKMIKAHEALYQRLS